MEAALDNAMCYTLTMSTDRAFFEEIYEAHGLEIKRFIFASARRDNQITEDIFQNTWENAWRYLKSLRERGKAKAWLYGIARNEAKRYFTSKHIKFEFPSEFGQVRDEDEGGAGFVLEPEDEESGAFPDRIAASELLSGLFERLTEPEQQLLILYYGYGVSLTELADLYGENYNTIKSISRRAMMKLRAYGEEIQDGE